MQDTLNESEHRVYEFEYNQGTTKGWASGLDETTKVLKKAEGHVQYFEGQVSERSIQFLSKDTEAQCRNKEVSALERQMVDLTGDLDFCKTQNATDKALLEGVQTALLIYEAAS